MKTASFFTYFGVGRISIALSAPRNMSGFAEYRKLNPSYKWFRSVDQAKYRELYFSEILGKLDPKQTWDELHELANGAEPVLLCWEKPPFTDSNWCHRSLVAEWFKTTLGEDVQEIILPPKKKVVTEKKQRMIQTDLFNHLI